VNKGDDTPDRMSPLLLACGQGQIECVDILLNHGATFTNENYCATLRGHDDIVQLLLNRGQMWIKRRRILWPKVVELLIKHGASIHQRDATTGETPLIEVITRKHIKEGDVPTIISIVKMLLEAGADTNARGFNVLFSYDIEGDTALNLCC